MLIMESVPKGPEERPHEELNDQYQKTKQSFYFTTLSTQNKTQWIGNVL